MGNNAAFTAFEATVIAVYDKGVLDQDLLSSLMEQYRNVDIDRGGMVGTLAKDGLDVEEIVIKIFGDTVPTRPDLPKNWEDWTPEQEATNEEYNERRCEAFAAISDKFGWS